MVVSWFSDDSSFSPGSFHSCSFRGWWFCTHSQSGQQNWSPSVWEAPIWFKPELCNEPILFHKTRLSFSFPLQTSVRCLWTRSQHTGSFPWLRGTAWSVEPENFILTQTTLTGLTPGPRCYAVRDYRVAATGRLSGTDNRWRWGSPMRASEERYSIIWLLHVMELFA